MNKICWSAWVDYFWIYESVFQMKNCNLCWDVNLYISLRLCTRLQSQLGKYILQKPLMKDCRGKLMS